MYSQPSQKEKEREIKQNEKAGKHFECKVGEDGDDEMVRAFRQKLLKKVASDNKGNGDGTSVDIGSCEGPVVSIPSDVKEKAKEMRAIKNDKNFSASAHQSALEKETGKRRRVALTMDEQADRFSFLKDAPLEGTFAKSIHLRHKPFNEVVRNVQCIRCGEWGHQSGDRECALRDYNPHDFARRKREDPLTYMQSTDFLIEKQKMVLRHAAASDYPAVPLAMEEEDEPESDPEADFIATLTAREKKLLLRRLQVLEGSAELVSEAHSSSSEDESGDSDSDSSDNAQDQKHSKKKKKDKKKDKKEKKIKKSKHSPKQRE